MGIFVDKFKVLSAKELSNGVLILIEARGDGCVSVCGLGLTMVALVMVEIWGEISPHGGIWWRSQWGNGIECQGVVVWSYNFNRSWRRPPPAGFWVLGLVPVRLVVAEIWCEDSPARNTIEYYCK